MGESQVVNQQEEVKMIEILRQRRSVRKYQDKKIEPGKIEILKEMILRSPSSRNFKPWQFIFVEDKNMLKKLSEAKPQGSGFLKDAVLGIVICGDENISDVWVEDCSIASILVQLASQSLGLGSCWIQIRKRNYNKEQTAEEYIQELFGLPENIKVESIISLGYPAEKKEGIPKEDLDWEKIKIWNKSTASI